jgi:N-acetylmuramoyl-L-alanine amidase
MARIVIDPGHGGTTDLPCSDAKHAKGPAHGTLEKMLTLDVALRVKGEIERRGGHMVLRYLLLAAAPRTRKAPLHGTEIDPLEPSDNRVNVT